MGAVWDGTSHCWLKSSFSTPNTSSHNLLLPTAGNRCPPCFINTNNCLTKLGTKVAYWKADGNTNDVYGINNGTFVGRAKYTTGYGTLGQAFLFNGSNYIDIPATSSLDVGASEYGMSVSLWMKASAAGPLFEWGNNYSNGFHVWLYPDINTLHVSLTADNAQRSMQPDNYFYNTWRHVMFVYDTPTGYGKLYCNGNLVNNHYYGQKVRPSTQSVFDHVSIGHRMRNNETITYITGALDDIMLWNRPLTETEVQSLYSSYQVYNVIPGFDFLGNNIGNSSDPKTSCDLNSTCVGYNSAGYYKHDFVNPHINITQNFYVHAVQVGMSFIQLQGWDSMGGNMAGMPVTVLLASDCAYQCTTRSGCVGAVWDGTSHWWCCARSRNLPGFDD